MKCFPFFYKNKLSLDAATTFFPKCINPPITPQSAIFGFIDHKVSYHLINYILLIFKYYVYKTRENGSLDVTVLKRNIHKIKNIEKQISFSKPEKKMLNKKETIVRKHMACILKYMVVQQLGWGRGNIVVV